MVQVSLLSLTGLLLTKSLRELVLSPYPNPQECHCLMMWCLGQAACLHEEAHELLQAVLCISMYLTDGRRITNRELKGKSYDLE